MVSNSPASEPASDITLDLDSDPGSEPERSPRLRISNAALAFATALLMLAAGVVALGKWLPLGERAAEETVRSFLEAVRAGDVDAALALVSEELRPGGFLVPEALDDRWKINEIAQVAYEDSPLGSIAQVYAEIEAYDGTRIGRRYPVLLDEGPVIYEAMGHLGSFPGGSLALELNGRAPALTGENVNAPILPGVYVPYESQPDTLDFGMGAFLALGDQFIELGAGHSADWFHTMRPSLSETGQEVLDQSVRAYLDDCAARAPAEGCPSASPPEDDRIAVSSEATWKITTYPKVSGSYAYRSDDEGHLFDLVTTEPGEIEVEAVVTGVDGAERSTILSCGLWMENVDAVFDTAGGVALTWGASSPGTCETMLEVE
jgi:hypothetical protein